MAKNASMNSTRNAVVGRHGYEAASQEAEAKAEALETLEAKAKATAFKGLRSQSQAFRKGSQFQSMFNRAKKNATTETNRLMLEAKAKATLLKKLRSQSQSRPFGKSRSQSRLPGPQKPKLKPASASYPCLVVWYHKH